MRDNLVWSFKNRTRQGRLWEKKDGWTRMWRMGEGDGGQGDDDGLDRRRESGRK